MNPDRIRKIIKHAGKLLQEVLSELFGDDGKEGSGRDETGDIGDARTNQTEHDQDLA